MNAPLSRIVELKTEAKNLRDLGIDGFDDAVKTAEKAIAIAGEALAGTSVYEVKREMSRELADCYGIIGGLQRRWGLELEGEARLVHLASSCRAYDTGFDQEWNDDYQNYKSYNLVNRLTTRLLIRAGLIDIDAEVDLAHGVKPRNVPKELRRARDRIIERLANKNDFWAEADLAMLQLLLDRADPAAAYARFLALSPLGWVFPSVLDGLRPLAALPALAGWPLQQAVALLEERQALAAPR